MSYKQSESLSFFENEGINANSKGIPTPSKEYQSPPKIS